MADLVAAGKRVLVVSGADYGADAAGVLFTRPQICHWQVLPHTKSGAPAALLIVFPELLPSASANIEPGGL